MNEFELIQRYFTRHAANAVLGVGDDAAIVRPTPHHDLHISTDMLVQGQHFFSDVSPYALGHKTLAVNLSDMAAMGATPCWAVLSLALPQLDKTWISEFSEGFFKLAEEHGLSVIGGDTTCGPLTLSVTIFGETPPGQALRRDAAQAGDDIWVSGSLGLAALAIQQRLHSNPSIPDSVIAECTQKLEYPTPRVALGKNLLGLAHSAIDISDGLMADLGHILARSNVGADIWFENIPTHPWLANNRRAFAEIITAGGDDYELCFTAPYSAREKIAKLAEDLCCSLTRVGRIEHKKNIRLTDKFEQPITLSNSGYTHF
ncbi:thiamine-phosphate kinase [Vogesella indigofera]|uniref:thiamine-phosphate kinase n=1 Tax=Vogesella indigofera TaxID=45465 RepID=UPI00234ECC08|nr:thiamine-phosphate kinase [Vogesella indigofera]MDC7707621.1 thiamine-phosphate kinase [Vogesella indigofera]